MICRTLLPLILAVTMLLIWADDTQAQTQGRSHSAQAANTCQNCGQHHHQQRPRLLSRFFDHFHVAPDFNHDVERDGSWRFTPQPYDRALYPKYIGGFHASQIQNAGVPPGDIGFRGNGIYWTPW